jgi:hypothetical protein
MMRMSGVSSSNPQLNLGDGRLKIDSPPTLRRRTSHLVSAVFSCFFVHACEMRPVILLACVLSVGACTYAVDHQPQALKKEGTSASSQR